MAKTWHPLGGNGGIPSDVMTTEVAGERKIKVTGISDDGLTAIDPDGNEYVVTIPSDMITVRESGLRSLSVASLTRQEVQMSKGMYAAGYSRRDGVPTGDTSATVVKATTKGIVIEEINSVFDFSNAGDGRYSYSLVIYFSNSNSNSFTYSGGVPAPLGKPLSGTYINNQLSGEVIGGVTIDSLTGDPDHLLRSVDYFLATQGVQESVSDTGVTFFDNGRKLIIPAGVEVLLVSTTGGTANGTANITTSFFSTELEELL